MTGRAIIGINTKMCIGANLLLQRCGHCFITKGEQVAQNLNGADEKT